MSFLFVPYAIHVIMVSIFVVYVFVDLPVVLNMTPELNLVQTDNYMAIISTRLSNLLGFRTSWH